MFLGVAYKIGTHLPIGTLFCHFVSSSILYLLLSYVFKRQYLNAFNATYLARSGFESSRYGCLDLSFSFALSQHTIRYTEYYHFTTETDMPSQYMLYMQL